MTKALKWRREAHRLHCQLTCERTTAARMRRRMDGDYAHMEDRELWTRARQGDGRAQAVLQERLYEEAVEVLA